MYVSINLERIFIISSGVKMGTILKFNDNNCVNGVDFIDNKSD